MAIPHGAEVWPACMPMPPQIHSMLPRVRLRADVVLDAGGESSGRVIRLLDRHIGEIFSGQVVEGVTRDEQSAEEVARWCKSTGNQLLRMEREGRDTLYWIRRRSSARE